MTGFHMLWEDYFGHVDRCARRAFTGETGPLPHTAADHSADPGLQDTQSRHRPGCPECLRVHRESIVSRHVLDKRQLVPINRSVASTSPTCPSAVRLLLTAWLWLSPVSRNSTQPLEPPPGSVEEAAKHYCMSLVFAFITLVILVKTRVLLATHFTCN